MDVGKKYALMIYQIQVVTLNGKEVVCSRKSILTYDIQFDFPIVNRSVYMRHPHIRITIRYLKIARVGKSILSGNFIIRYDKIYHI